MKSLKEFYSDSETRDNVKAYLIEFLTQKAVEKVFNRENTEGVAEAKQIIEDAFENMSVMFQSKAEKKPQINEAR